MIPLPTSPIPKYHQLYEAIRQQIAQGELPANSQLPTEEALCQRYGVSRGTVRKAFDALANEGLIRREQGRGNFVNPPQPTLGTFSISDQHHFSAQKLALEVQLTSTEAAQKLDLPFQTPVIYAAQLQHLNSKPVLYEERYLAQSLCPQLIHEDIDAQSLHWLLLHKYKLPLVRVAHVIESRPVGEHHASYLGLTATSPIFFVDRLTYTRYEEKIIPAVWYRAWCRGDEYQFQAEFLSAL